MGYVHVGVFLIRFRATEVQILAGLRPPRAGRVKLRLRQAPVPSAPLQECRAQGWALSAPGAPEVPPQLLEWSPWNKPCKVSGAHDRRVFGKFAFAIPLYPGKRKPVFCVPQTSAVTCIHKRVLLQATKRFPTQIFTLLRTF